MENEKFAQFGTKVLKIHTEGHKLPLFGKIIEFGDPFLTVERKDGRLVLIKRNQIVSIEPTRIQPPSGVI